MAPRVLGSLRMSSSNDIGRVGYIVLGAAFLTMATGCTSLTRSDEIKINKDEPKSLRAAPPPAQPTPVAPAANAVQAPARPAAKMAGTG